MKTTAKWIFVALAVVPFSTFIAVGIAEGLLLYKAVEWLKGS